ncbi:MAG TPA: AsmA-like C-terminal region-containing protein, partial [Stellaceae bacterium]|nr:AsmA-like C-terminal region-containing protein [Stellaceae bacterium]
LLRWFGSFAAVLILAALFAIWRLMQGPIELNWLTPYVEAALDRSDVGLKVAISGVRLAIDRGTHQLDLRAEDVRVSLPDGRPLANFPEMATSFGLGALLRGRLAPTEVVVERPVLHLLRDAGGTITAQIGSDQEAGPPLGPQMLERLAGPRQRDAPLGLLRRLDIRGATVIVDDRSSGHTWRADRVDFAVDRSEKGVRGDFSLAVRIGDSLPELHAFYRYFADRQVLDLDMTIDGVEPAAIPPLIPELTQLQHVDAPVSGTLRTRIDLKQNRPQGSRLDLTLGSGKLNSEWFAGGSLAFESGELRAVYSPEDAAVRLTGLALDLGGGTQLALAGELGGITPELVAALPEARPAGHVVGRLTGSLTHVPVTRLAALWPPAFSPGGRHWVLQNVRDGMLDEASAQLALDLDPAAHSAALRDASGTLRYHDLTINYFDGLPLVRNVDGTAVFAGSHLDFVPTTGTLKGLKVTGGSLKLTELDGPTEWLTIDLPIAGPLRDALEVIDAKPLGFAHAAGIDPAHVGGRAVTQLHFRFPLLADLKLAQIEYGAKSTITGGSINKVALDRGITDGNLALDIVQQSGAHAHGTARFEGIPGKLDATVFFHPKDGPRATYRVGMVLDDAAQKTLGLDAAPDRITGPIAVDATYSAFAGGRGEAAAVFDLRDAALAIPEAGWKKPAGQPANAKLSLDFDKDGLKLIPHIEVRAAGLDGRFAVQPTADRKSIERLQIGRLVIGDNELSGLVTRRQGGGWRADIHAARLDAHHLLKQATSGGSSPQAAPLAVNARIDRLIFGARRELRQVAAQLVRSGGIWRFGQIDGHYANGHELSLRFGEDDGSRLTLRSDDLGAALQLLDIADGVSGGKLTVEGRLGEAGGKRTLRAHVEGQNYTLARTPIIARLLALPSLTGIASTLSGSGLPFTTLHGDFTFDGSRLNLDRLLAFGESLGVTASGWDDLDRDWLELHGTVAPAYLLNSMIGNVPVIGPLLGGGSQGLFAANYRLSGKGDDPQVSVNPLSALAPGFLRQLFAPITDVPAPAAAPATGH